GQEPMNRSAFDLSGIILGCVELARPLLIERGITLTVDGPALEITGDAEKLGMVVTNLLTNAIEYNHNGGAIKITLRRDNNLAVLTVSDTGRGISSADLPRLFDRFYRADKSRSSGNAGLGLAKSKAIVAAHGGTIDAAAGEQAGAVFTVRLPCSC
ncbi:MAG: sensor histidine kinase, partial [Limisphaerales bacterium]